MNTIDSKLPTVMNTWKAALAALLLAGASTYIDSAFAATLPNGSILNITAGAQNASGVWINSWFGMDMDSSQTIQTTERTPINYGAMSGGGCVTGTLSVGSGIPIGSVITASGSHGNCIDGTESPAFDKWEFFGNTGMDYLSTAATDNGNGTLAWSGWTVTWNGIAAIPMNARAWQPSTCPTSGCTGWTFTDGAARFVWNGVNGGAYTLDYTATVPAGDPSGFGNVKYYLRLTGTVTLPSYSLNNDAVVAKTGAAKTIDVLSNDSISSYSSPVVTINTNGTLGTAVANADNTITYTPTTTGTDTFTYRVTANSGIDLGTATVTVTITSALPPTASADSATTSGTTAKTISVLSNDTAGDYAISTSTVAISTAASHGTATANSSGTVTYTATSGFSGTDTFQYTVKDTAGNTSNAASVTVTVQATNPASASGTLTPGTTATAAGGTPASTGGGLTTSNVGTDSALSQQCVGGCFDVKVTGLTSGGSVKIVLPLSTTIPANAVYRKLVSGTWQDFSTSGSNNIASAASISAGVCPAAGSSSYTSGLTAGNDCLQLTIMDGGADDEDGLANGTVLDPGGVGVKGTSADLRTGSTGGCSISTNQNIDDMWKRGDWLLLLGFVAWLGMVIRRKQNRT